MLVLGRGERTGGLALIAAGGVLPDVALILFYGYQRVFRGETEERIWRELYFEPASQSFFDLPHSLPLLAAALAASLWWRARWAALLASSMLLHGLADLLLHHDDGHRHFFPFADWRFRSPVSYWDPDHYGHLAGGLEALAVAVAAVLLLRAHPRLGARALVGGLTAAYGAFLVFAGLNWG